MEKDNTTTEVVETVVEETTITPEVKQEEKTFTQEQVNSIVAKQIKELKEKESAKIEEAKLSNEELATRLANLEAERAAEIAERELRESIKNKTEVEGKLNLLKTYISERVLEEHSENITALTLLKVNVESDPIEKLKGTADVVIASLPGVLKGSVGNGSTLNKGTAQVVKEEEEKSAPELEKGYYTLAGAKLDYTDAQYDRLSFEQKRNIKKIN